MTFSWFRRRSRRATPVLPSLDQLAELVERVIAEVEQVATPAEEAPGAVEGHVLFAPATDGYRVLARGGGIPACGSELEHEGVRFRVLRHGPSPFPGDRRRCAFLERQEPPQADRTFER
jgi:hypothetical protein